VLLHKRPGEKVAAGDVLAELRADDATRIPAALSAAAEAIVVAKQPAPGPQLIIDRIG
jgi:thymidine phosphorylase